jgi:hypothetical protein
MISSFSIKDEKMTDINDDYEEIPLAELKP